MKTKLEVLVEILQVSDVEKEVIDRLIINYYNQSDTNVFETESINYRVLGLTEQDDAVYELAERQFYDITEEFQDLVFRKPYIYSRLIDTIDKNASIELIRETLDELDVAESFGEIFLIEDSGYFIYKTN